MVDKYFNFSGVMCEFCNKKLRTFIKKDDWDNRKLHKKCYKEKLKQDRLKLYLTLTFNNNLIL